MTAYKKVLVIGATSGIGKALADKFVESGSFVIAVGRRQENLDEFVKKHGETNSQGISFDITKLELISDFVSKVTAEHGDLDLVLLNSGIQRPLDFTKPETVDMDVVMLEFTTNYLSQVALTKAFLPFLQSKSSESALVYMTSGLALVPMPKVPNYCATKAAMHHFVLSLREQLSASNIKIIEIYPPAVQTELHDYQGKETGRSVGMPLDEFTKEAWQGLVDGKNDIPVGTSEGSFQAIEVKRQELFQKMVQRFKESS